MIELELEWILGKCVLLLVWLVTAGPFIDHSLEILKYWPAPSPYRLIIANQPKQIKDQSVRNCDILELEMVLELDRRSQFD